MRRDDGTPHGAVFIPFAYYEAAANLLTNAALTRSARSRSSSTARCRIARGGEPKAAAGHRHRLWRARRGLIEGAGGEGPGPWFF